MKYYCYASFLDSKQKKQVSFYRHLQNVFFCAVMTNYYMRLAIWEVLCRRIKSNKKN